MPSGTRTGAAGVVDSAPGEVETGGEGDGAEVGVHPERRRAAAAVAARTPAARAGERTDRRSTCRVYVAFPFVSFEQPARALISPNSTGQPLPVISASGSAQERSIAEESFSSSETPTPSWPDDACAESVDVSVALACARACGR